MATLRFGIRSRVRSRVWLVRLIFVEVIDDEVIFLFAGLGLEFVGVLRVKFFDFLDNPPKLDSIFGIFFEHHFGLVVFFLFFFFDFLFLEFCLFGLLPFFSFLILSFLYLFEPFSLFLLFPLLLLRVQCQFVRDTGRGYEILKHVSMSITTS